MKSYQITASLPFSWCRFCTRMDLKTDRFWVNGKVEEIGNRCSNEQICEACEKARHAEGIEIRGDSKIAVQEPKTCDIVKP